MKLFYQQPKLDPQKIHDTVSKGYGIEHPEHVGGYIGAFLFHIPDVYVSDKVAQKMQQYGKTADVLMKMINRFQREDYGFITKYEWENNGETRYFSFSSSWMIGRYSEKDLCGIVLETLYDISLFYFPEEDIDDILNEQFAKCCREKDITNGDLSKWRVNQLRYVKNFNFYSQE